MRVAMFEFKVRSVRLARNSFAIMAGMLTALELRCEVPGKPDSLEKMSRRDFVDDAEIIFATGVAH